MGPIWAVVIAGAVLLVLVMGFKDYKKNKEEE